MIAPEHYQHNALVVVLVVLELVVVVSREERRAQVKQPQVPALRAYESS